MRIGWYGLVAVGAVASVASCGPLGLVGVAALAAWSGDEIFSPEPSTVRVGGTITGLSGSVTLQLNDLERITRTEDGPFSFENPIANRTLFSVQLIEAPTEQDCVLHTDSEKATPKSANSVRLTCQTRTYSIGGTVTGLDGSVGIRINNGEILSLTDNGPFAFTTKLPKGELYEIDVPNHPTGQKCELRAGNRGTVAGDVQSLQVECHTFVSLATYQEATLVYQGTDPAALKSPWGNPVFAGGRLYVSDRSANRILVFDGLPAQSNAPAQLVLGQPNPESTDSHRGADGFSSPEGLSSNAAGQLAVADKGNHRIIIYSQLPTPELPDPLKAVLGQPDFDTPSTAACDEFSLARPEGVFLKDTKLTGTKLTETKLLVADTLHNRVLIWTWDKDHPLRNGQEASLVLGQNSLSTCAANNGVPASPTASTLNLPEGVWTDGTRVLVADTGNNRVLLWNTFPTSNGQSADVVLGAENFESSTPDRARGRMFTPKAVIATDYQVFVADHGNNRVLVWNLFPLKIDSLVSRVLPDEVLGQPNFTSRTPPSNPTNQSLYGPSGLLAAEKSVIVADSLNKRLLRFETR